MVRGKKSAVIALFGHRGTADFSYSAKYSLASAITALREHFTPTVNVVVEHHTFRKRVQGAQESLVQCLITRACCDV